MRPLPKKSAAVLAAAVSSLALAVSDAPHAQAACLPSNPSSTCLTFDPSSASTLANRTGFFGEFTPDVVIDPDNRYNRARVQFKFTGSWTTPFTLSGIAITGDGITSSLSFGTETITTPTADFDDNSTSWLNLDSLVSVLNFSNSSISYVIPADAAGIGSSIEARIEYRSVNAAQQNASTTNSISTAVSLNTVPGPLPLAGAGVAFATSRQLRRRLRAAS